MNMPVPPAFANWKVILGLLKVIIAPPPLTIGETLPVMVAVKVVLCPPVIPVGAVKVTFKVKVPESCAAGAVVSVKVPKRSLPLKEPLPKMVVPVKLLPAKLKFVVVAGLAPVIVPVVKPVMVTSSARASTCVSVKQTRAIKQKARVLIVPEMRVVIVFSRFKLLKQFAPELRVAKCFTEFVLRWLLRCRVPKDNALRLFIDHHDKIYTVCER